MKYVGGRNTSKKMGQVRGQLQASNALLSGGQKGHSAVLDHQGEMA